MKHTVYRITNNLNGMTYIGKHSTEDINDSYMGRGIGIVWAIEEHGRANFTKETLHIFEDEDSAYSMEAELVDEECIYDPNTYNIMTGGRMGESRIRCGWKSNRYTARRKANRLKKQAEADRWPTIYY